MLPNITVTLTESNAPFARYTFALLMCDTYSVSGPPFALHRCDEQRKYFRNCI